MPCTLLSACTVLPSLSQNLAAQTWGNTVPCHVTRQCQHFGAAHRPAHFKWCMTGARRGETLHCLCALTDAHKYSEPNGQDSCVHSSTCRQRYRSRHTATHRSARSRHQAALARRACRGCHDGQNASGDAQGPITQGFRLAASPNTVGTTRAWDKLWLFLFSRFVSLL